MIEAVLEQPTTETKVASPIYLVRYGAVPEVARFVSSESLAPGRGERVVVETHRGLQMGSVFERLKPKHGPAEPEPDFRIDRIATPEDQSTAGQLIRDCEEAFATWCDRILQWNLNLELIDLEWTLDRQKQILYVLCERGPDSTKLALQAAAAGLGIVEVQPVSSTGLVQPEPSGGGCGSGGGGCGCSH